MPCGVAVQEPVLERFRYLISIGRAAVIIAHFDPTAFNRVDYRHGAVVDLEL